MDGKAGQWKKATDSSLTWQQRLRSWGQDCVSRLQRKLQEMAYLSLQHQLLGEKCGFLTEWLPFLHQAWQVSCSSGTFNACIERKEKSVRKCAEALLTPPLSTWEESSAWLPFGPSWCHTAYRKGFPHCQPRHGLLENSCSWLQTPPLYSDFMPGS